MAYKGLDWTASARSLTVRDKGTKIPGLSAPPVGQIVEKPRVLPLLARFAMPRRPRVVPLKVVDRAARRPDPPDELPAREAALWTAIVNSRRPNWIDNPASELMLKLYVQAAIIGEDLSRRARGDVHFHNRLIR